MLTRGERFKDARTVYNKNGNQTMAEVAAITGVSASLIKELEDDFSKRDFGYKKIASLAVHYGVSANWLLGITEDHNIIPCATDELGLSESAISSICDYKNMSTGALSGLDMLLNAIDFFGVCVAVNQIKECVESLTNVEWPSIDFEMQRKIEGEIVATHPELQGRFIVKYGDQAISSLVRNAKNYFEMAIDRATGLENRRDIGIK